MTLEQFVRPLATVGARQTVEHAARLMRDQGVGCLLVMDAHEDRPFGIVTDRDLVVRLLAEGLEPTARVEDFATYGPFKLNIHETIETAAAQMRIHGVRRLPIVDDAGQAVGIVTADDLLVILGRGLADVCGGIENASDATDSR